jgi:hypothetical protein
MTADTGSTLTARWTGPSLPESRSARRAGGAATRPPSSAARCSASA